MRVAYADPPYPGMAHLYKGHPDYDGEIDHAALLERLRSEYDGFVLHTASTTVGTYFPLRDGERIGAWVKPFASFKPGKHYSMPWAWEPVIFKPCRDPKHGRMVRPLRDWIAESITLKRGLVGAKPEAVCWWAFECAGLEPTDELVDLYPGSGAVSRAWFSWCRAMRLGLFDREVQP